MEYFIDLHNKIKDERRLDKICDGPKVGGDWKFQLAFIAPVSGAASPIARLQLPGQYACITIKSISHGHGGDESSQ